MAATFTAKVVLQMLDQLSGPMEKAGKTVSREMNVMEKSFKRLKGIGLEMVGTFSGLVAVGASLARFAHDVRDLSRELNNLAAAGTKINAKGGIARFTDADRKEAIDSAIRTSKALNISPAIPLTDQRIALLANLTKEQAQAVRGPYSAFAKSQGINEGEAPEIFKNLTAALRDFRMPITSETATILTEKLARAASASGATVPQLLETTKLVGPLVAATGGTVDDMLALAMVGARKGIKGSEMGVFYRSLITSLAAMKPKGLAIILQKMMSDLPLEAIPAGATKAEAKAIGERNMAKAYAEYLRRYAPTTTQTGPQLKEAMRGQFPGATIDDTSDAEFAAAAAERNLDKRSEMLRALMDRYQLATGDENLEERNRAISNLSMGFSTRIDVAKFVKDAIAAGITTPDFIKIIQGRQVGRLTAVEQDMVDYFNEQKKLQAVTAGGPSLITTQIEEMNKGLDGALSRIENAMKRVALAFDDPNNPAGGAVVVLLTKIANGIDRLAGILTAKTVKEAWDKSWELFKDHPFVTTAVGALGLGGLASLLRGGWNAVTWGFRGLGPLLGLTTKTGEAGLMSRLLGRFFRAGGGKVLGPLGILWSLIDPDTFGKPGASPDEKNWPGMDTGNPMFRKGRRDIDDLRPYGGMTEVQYKAQYAADEIDKATEAIGKDFEQITKGWQDMQRRAEEAADAISKIPGGAVNPADAVSGFGHPVSGAWPAGITSGMFGSRRGGTGARAYGGFPGAGPLAGGTGHFGGGIKFTGSVESARAYLAAGSYHRGRRGDTAFLHPELALHLAALLRAHPGLRLLSGYRIGPSKLGSMTMHGIGAAGDVAGSERLSDAELARFGLYRPWRSAHERNHLQLIGTGRHGSPMGYWAMRGHGEDPETRNKVWRISAPIQVKSEIQLDKEKVGSALTSHFHRRGRRIPSEIHPR
jgi:hypothetical protein